MFRFIRLAFEVYISKDLVHLRILLPRADSKLDKEQETKKDFKEKIGTMTLFYKSIHMIGQINAVNTFLNWIFNHVKVSMEIFYNQGEVFFYVTSYRTNITLIKQQITSNYPDAEIKEIPKEKLPDIKPVGYVLESASIGKETDDIYPIKTYKYLEDDSISNWTNNF